MTPVLTQVKLIVRVLEASKESNQEANSSKIEILLVDLSKDEGENENQVLIIPEMEVKFGSEMQLYGFFILREDDEVSATENENKEYVQ